MDVLPLDHEDFYNLVLSADARCGFTDYVDDQTWELQLTGEPSAILLRTSMGLRVGDLRVFPIFHFDDQEIQDPYFFAHPPQFIRIFPDYIHLDCSPFEHLEVSIEIWVPESHAISARLTLINHDRKPHRVGTELASLMDSMEKGSPMGLTKLGMNWVLSGSSRGVFPVIFMSGGTKPGTGYAPGLLSESMLAAGEEKRITWALAGCRDALKSLEKAREICNRPWESSIQVLEKLNRDSELIIRTGRPGWDAALFYSMNTAKRLIHHGTGQISVPTCVLSRNTDQGYSMRGNGSDYGYLWEGPTVLDAWYFTHLLLSGESTFYKELISNYLESQQENGKLGFRINANKTPRWHHAQPLLATMTELVYGDDSDIDGLQKVFPGLVKYFFYWLSPVMDKDQDGIPEWSHFLQTGLEDLPIFHQGSGDKEDYPSKYIESPALLAMLYAECQSLIHIAHKIEKNELLIELDQISEKLKGLLEESWDEKIHSYRHLDHISHTWTSGERYCVLKGSQSHLIRRANTPNSRFVVECRKKIDHNLQVKMVGRYGRIMISEELSSKDFTTNGQTNIAITRNVFSHIERIVIKGISEKEKVIIRRPDISQLDISLLLPLWAGMVDPDRAKEMVNKGLVHRLESDFGLVMLLPQNRKILHEQINSIHFPWNTFVIEGLLKYGYQREAGKLFEKLLLCCETSLRKNHHFSQSYSPITGMGFGVQDHLHGLVSPELLLQMIGIKRIDPRYGVLVEGANPFPTAIVVKYKGITVERNGDTTKVEFPDGSTTSTLGTGRILIPYPGHERKETA
jgi:hypothetical protein